MIFGVWVSAVIVASERACVCSDHEEWKRPFPAWLVGAPLESMVLYG